MSTTIANRSEIPDAACYVLSNDTFFSYWPKPFGQNDGMINTIILPCASRVEAQSVANHARNNRTDQQYVRIVCDKPRLRKGHWYSLATREEFASWYSRKPKA